MILEISTEIEELLRKRVAAGGYASVNDVLCQALHLLEQHDRFLQSNREAVRAQIEEARQSLDRGEGVDGEEVFDRLFKELDSLEPD